MVSRTVPRLGGHVIKDKLYSQSSLDRLRGPSESQASEGQFSVIQPAAKIQRLESESRWKFSLWNKHWYITFLNLSALER